MKGTKVFPSEIQDFIINNNQGKTLEEITELVNKIFQKSYTQNQLRSFRKNHRLKSGLTGRFEKGHSPKNKGRKGWCPSGCEKGWFKNGFRPHNAVPVGTEVMATIGYLKIKVAEPNVWRFKHIMEWEKHHGKVPEGSLISFKDGNHRNCAIENLMLVTRAENAILNHQNMRSNAPELTETGLILAKLKHKISTIQKEKN